MEIVKVVQSDIKHEMPLDSFLTGLVAELSRATVPVRSKWFRRDGEVDQDELAKQIKAAGSRFIQNIRDNMP